MNTDLERLRARALKLAAMANDTRGSAAEAETARRMLDKALATLGITEADLTGQDKPQRRVFKVADKLASELLAQVLFKVLDTQNLHWGELPKERWVDLTTAQHIEVQMMLSVLGPAMRKHMDAAFLGFIIANELHSTAATDGKGPALTPEEREKLRAAAKLAMVTTPTAVHTQIGHAR